jgi:hypothetical protein
MRALSGAAGQQATPQGTRSLTAANAGEYASNAREPAADFLRACSRSFEQQGQECQMDELQTCVELSLAVLP